MAAPPEVTLQDLSGQWVMNKTLSDNVDPLLAMQGVGWLQRKLVGLATVTLSISQYKSEDSLTHIDIEVTATGGIKGTTEHRTLDWEVRGHKDQMFGEVKGQSRWIKLAELEDDTGDGFLKKAWLDEGEQYIQSSVTRVDGAWTSNQIWGFEEIQGIRYYVRHVVVRTKNDRKKARLVYDFKGMLTPNKPDEL